MCEYEVFHSPCSHVISLFVFISTSAMHLFEDATKNDETPWTEKDTQSAVSI